MADTKNIQHLYCTPIEHCTPQNIAPQFLSARGGLDDLHLFFFASFSSDKIWLVDYSLNHTAWKDSFAKSNDEEW